MNDFDLVLKCLNSAVEDDPAAIQALCCNLVPCNDKLADHPLIPVDMFPGGGFIIGTIGLINGILEAMNMPLVAMKFDDIPDSDGRRKFLGFCRHSYKDPHLVNPVYTPIRNCQRDIRHDASKYFNPSQQDISHVIYKNIFLDLCRERILKELNNHDILQSDQTKIINDTFDKMSYATTLDDISDSLPKPDTTELFKHDDQK